MRCLLLASIATLAACASAPPPVPAAPTPRSNASANATPATDVAIPFEVFGLVVDAVAAQSALSIAPR